MQTATISITTEIETKRKAEKKAGELGMNLSSLMTQWLKQFVKTKTVNFSTAEEEPSDYLIKEMKRAKEHRLAGKGSPIFTSDEKLIKKDPKHYRHVDTMEEWFTQQGI